MEKMKLGKVLVSFVIPVYNSQDYIKECIDSILSIKEDNFEILMIDDGSTDNSRAVCEQYLENNRIHLYTQSNKGVSAARNVGIDHAVGKYITFIDSDDRIQLTDFSFLKSEKDLYCLGMKRFSSKSETAIKFTKELDIYDQFVKYPAYMNSMCNKFFKLERIRTNEIRMDEKQKYREDMLFVISYLQTTPQVEYVDNDYYYYRTNMHSASKRKVTRSIIDNNVASADKILILIKGRSNCLEKYLLVAPVLPLLTDIHCYDYQTYKNRVNCFLIWYYDRNMFHCLMSVFAALNLRCLCNLVMYFKRRIIIR